MQTPEDGKVRVAFAELIIFPDGGISRLPVHGRPA
jgi:allantoicase